MVESVLVLSFSIDIRFLKIIHRIKCLTSGGTKKTAGATVELAALTWLGIRSVKLSVPFKKGGISMDVRGKVAIVTGGAYGIGRAIALALADEGARVCVFDRSVEALQTVVDEIEAKHPGQAIGAAGDAASTDDISRVLQLTREAFGPIELYCANAGIASPGVALDDKAWSESVETNLLAHIRAANMLLPEWQERGGGYFLITSSGAGLTTQLGDVAYSVTKHAAVALAEWLSITYHECGVRVSCLCPLGVKTNMLQQLLATEEYDYSGAVGRVLDADEVAQVVIEGIRNEQFLILPQPEVLEFFRRKAADYDRWLGGMRRLQSQIRR